MSGAPLPINHRVNSWLKAVRLIAPAARGRGFSFEIARDFHYKTFTWP
jgi:hypothetical protein